MTTFALSYLAVITVAAALWIFVPGPIGARAGAVFHRLTSAPRQGSDIAALLEEK